MTNQRPNIIFIITDQQRYDTIGALGYTYMETPALDRLAAEGTTFTHCYAAGASCVPSRASLFTGYYPHTVGITRNGDLWRHTWVERLAQSGYRCVNIGKMHTEPMDTPAGFHERYVVENKERYRPVPGINRDYFDEWDRALAAHGLEKPNRDFYSQLPDYQERLGAYEWPLEPHLHPDTFVGNTALWWLERYPKTEPLFLQVGFPGPHPPYDPLEEEVDRYMDMELPIANVSQADIDSQPPPLDHLRKWHMEMNPDAAPHRLDAKPEWRHRQRAYYLANMTMIDRKIDEILSSLKKLGYLENAVVVFTSDHGDCLGDHGLNQKWNCYEQITRMPLILWGPGRVPAGKMTDGLVQHMDVVPWLLDLAEIDVPETFESVSLAPALTDSNFEGRDAVYCEQGHDRPLPTKLMTMVRTYQWKLVHFLGEEFGQLFNLKEDPEEEVNLWNDVSKANIKQEMLERLYLWRMESQQHTADWAEICR
jgi:arylsulfatase A-like enzyme